MLTRRRFLTGLAALSLTPAASAQGGREQLLKILRNGSPTGWRIVDGYAQEGTVFGPVRVPKVELWSLVEGKPASELLTSANVLVHESCHLYSHVQALGALAGAPGFAFFPDVQSRIVVAQTETFPAREAVSSCPDFLRATGRFTTYVDANSANLTTQKDGIYGLMNELGAYFCGTCAAVEVLRHMVKTPRAYPGDWGRFLVDPMGTMLATQEFRGYILAYLDHARTAHPKIYAGLLANRELWRAYHAIQSAYAQLARDYFRQLPRLAARVGAKVDGDYVVVGAARWPRGKTEFDRLRSRLDASRPLRAMERAVASY